MGKDREMLSLPEGVVYEEAKVCLPGETEDLSLFPPEVRARVDDVLAKELMHFLRVPASSLIPDSTNRAV